MKFMSVVGHNSPAKFILFFLPELSLELLDREVFLCLVHPFLPFCLMALGLL